MSNQNENSTSTNEDTRNTVRSQSTIGGKNVTTDKTTDHLLAVDQTPGCNGTKHKTIIARQPLVSVLAPRTKQSIKRDRPKNVTTLTSGEFAQLLKTCNVTVKSVRSSDTGDKKPVKKTPGDGAVVLRPTWTRGKSVAPPLKWHHTNFEPNKQLKTGKRKTCKAVSVTVAKTPSQRRNEPRKKQHDDHTGALASHALPLTQAWSDIASRDQASADTIKETSDAIEVLLPQNSDPFLSDCDVRDVSTASEILATQESATEGIEGLLSNIEIPESCDKTRGKESGDVNMDKEWKSFVRMSGKFVLCCADESKL